MKLNLVLFTPILVILLGFPVNTWSETKKVTVNKPQRKSGTPAKKTKNACNAFYSAVAKKSNKNKLTSDTSKKSLALVSSPPREDQIREIVEIRDGDKQFPPTTYFGSEFVDQYSYYQDVSGDRITVTIFPDVSPFSSRNSVNPQGSTISTSSNTHIVQHGRTQTALSTSANVANDREMARNYALKFYEPLDPSGMEMLINAILKSPVHLNQARNLFQGINNSRKVELANFGLNRYFWFKPDGTSNYVAGRVLDIHLHRKPISFVFLVEYMSEPNPETGIRNRKVLQLNELEFQSIQSHVREMNVDRSNAMEEFFDSLTPNEIDTLKLAKSMSLKLYGYFDIRRGPGIDESNVSPALQTMNNISHLAIQSHIIREFGSIDDLLTPAEKKLQSPNFMDVFSRLHPRYVMKRFGDEKAINTEFYWIITEDGQLKVMPAMNRKNNLKPQILRFAAGRKVFAGGTFVFRSDGSLDVQMNANGFQQNDLSWGSHQSFTTENGDVASFVKIAFGIHASRKVNNLQAEHLENWLREDRFGTGKGGSFTGGHRRENEYDYADMSFDFTAKMKTKAETATTSNKETLTWDIEKAQPLSLSDFLKLRNTHERNELVKLEWAHYVLGTNSEMTFENIKKTYRKLAIRFHPDINKEVHATKTMQSITTAYGIIKQTLSDLK